MSAYKGATGSRSQSICELTVPTKPMMWMMWWKKVDHNIGVYVPYSFQTVVLKKLIKLVPQMDSITSKPLLTKTAMEGSHLYIVVCVEVNIRIYLHRGYYWKNAYWLIGPRQGVVKACSRFYACIFSLLIKPELHSKTRELPTWINIV